MQVISPIIQCHPFVWASDDMDKTLTPIPLRMAQDAKSLYLSSETSTCGRVISPRHTRAFQHLYRHESIRVQHYAFASPHSSTDVRLHSNIYGPREINHYVEEIGRWSITLTRPLHCDPGIEFHHPLLCFYPQYRDTRVLSGGEPLPRESPQVRHICQPDVDSADVVVSNGW